MPSRGSREYTAAGECTVDKGVHGRKWMRGVKVRAWFALGPAQVVWGASLAVLSSRPRDVRPSEGFASVEGSRRNKPRMSDL